MATEDFEGFTTGVQPTGWSTAWEGGTWTVETVDLNKVLRCAPAAANADRVLVLDSTDGWTNFEVVFRTRQGNADDSAGRGGIVLHAAGTGASRDGYYGRLSGTLGAAGDNFTLLRVDSGSATVLSSIAFASPIQAWTWIKSRRVGTNIKIKLWVDGTQEPAAWAIDETDGTYTTGKVGVYCRQGGTSSVDPPFDFDNFSVQHYNTASVILTLNDPASGGSAWASKTGLAVDVSVDRDSAPFYSATGQSTNGSGELAIAATGCPLASGTQTVWIRVTDSDGTAGGVGNDSLAFYSPVSVTVA